MIEIVFKVVFICSLEKDINTDTVVKNMLEIEWLQNSETLKSFHEIDRAILFTVEEAWRKA